MKRRDLVTVLAAGTSIILTQQTVYYDNGEWLSTKYLSKWHDSVNTLVSIQDTKYTH
jgi:hypothetical protein